MKTKVLSLFAVLSIVISLFAFGGSVAAVEPKYCGEPTAVTLFAGQTIDAGTVTVSNDENFLYVTYTAANGWLLSQSHLAVADSLASIPQTEKGNPQIGQFAYQRSQAPPVAGDT